MEIPRPTSLIDVITDGVLGQSCIDQAFAAQLGRVTGVEFNLSDDATSANVRINRAAGAHFDTTGEVIAWIDGQELEWVSTRGQDLSIPELHGVQPLHDDLITAARTLYNNAPAFIAPLCNGRSALVIINHTPKLDDARRGLIEALPRLRPGMDHKRALSSFAAFRNLGIRFEHNRIAFSDGTSILLQEGQIIEITGGLGLRDVRADAAFMSAEHQLLFDAISSSHNVTFNSDTNVATVENEHQVRALPLAVIDGSRWVWAWSLRELDGQATAGLARFGYDNGLLLLTNPEITVDQAQAFDLIDVAKQVLRVWTHAVVRQEDGTAVVLLLDHPRLHLPPASHAAVEATLYHRLPSDIDARRAVASYAAHRELPFDGFAITVEGQQINVTFEGDRLIKVG
ncbi:hypothetical protein N24_1040 [Corynebacterium suranareeae]|uniref:Uncharacterized protein n=1 Tax=Corynebacterium suranareeae TaxID=2506452 RepID=A0A169RT97_9CORY|nr:DUF6882 domain-containing protein [Corynebacterium suranareeae]BAU95302.1 hypothetical protein N24_1040 [Corynebacterium suranareeae]